MKRNRKINWAAVKEVLGDLRELRVSDSGDRALRISNDFLDDGKELVEGDFDDFDSRSERPVRPDRNPYGWGEDEDDTELEWWEEDLDEDLEEEDLEEDFEEGPL